MRDALAGMPSDVVRIKKRTFIILCGMLLILALSVGGLAYSVLVQGEDIKTGVSSSCANSQALIELVTDPALQVPPDVVARLEDVARECPD